MNESFSDELISAFLDGELTAEEQALVEQTLMDSVEQRHVFEELRALRGGLQSLPTHKLPADFSQRVLRKAERAMQDAQPTSLVSPVLSAAAEPVIDAGSTAVSLAAPVSPAAGFSRASSNRGKFRVVVAACAAIAAALLVALYAPNIDLLPTVPDRVAKNLTDREKVEEGQKFLRTEGPAPLAERPAVDTVPEALNQKEQALPRIGDESKGEEGELEEGTSAGRKSIVGEKADARTGGTKGAASPVPGDAPRFGGGQGIGEKQDVAAGPPRGDVADDSKLYKYADAGEGDLDRRTEVLSKSLKLRESAESKLVVIPVNCTRQALESGAFDNVLKRHNVLFDDAHDDVAAADDKQTKDADEVRRESRGLRERASAAGVDMVVVEATVAQIDGILADFQAQRDQFLGVTVQPLAEDTLGQSLLARSFRAKRSLTRTEDLLKLAATEDEAARRRASFKESEAPAALPAGPAAPGGIGRPAEPRTALDKVAGGEPSPRGGAGGGGLRSFVPGPGIPGASGGAPPAPAPAKPGAAGKELSKNEPSAAAVKQTEEAKVLAEKGRSANETGAAASAGRASRIASAQFKVFDRLRNDGESQDAYSAKAKDAGQGKAEGLHRPDAPERKGDLKQLVGGVDGIEKAATKKTAAFAEKAPAEAKPRAEVPLQDVDKNLKDGAEGGTSPGKPSDDNLDRLNVRAMALQQKADRASLERTPHERVRVLFVIKAVEEE